MIRNAFLGGYTVFASDVVIRSSSGAHNTQHWQLLFVGTWHISGLQWLEWLSCNSWRSLSVKYIEWLLGS
jgi:hypothetical protein